MRTHWLWTLWLRKWKSWLFVGPWRSPWITHLEVVKILRNLPQSWRWQRVVKLASVCTPCTTSTKCFAELESSKRPWWRNWSSLLTVSRPPAATQALKNAGPEGALVEEEEHRLKKRPSGDWSNQRKIECCVHGGCRCHRVGDGIGANASVRVEDMCLLEANRSLTSPR